MVKLMGHLAMGLLFAAPAWFVWDGRLSLSFVGFVLATSMLPDVDLALQVVVPGVHHHGVTHTIGFVVVASVLAGYLVADVAAPALERWWLRSDDRLAARRTRYLFVTGGLLVGGLSHVLADMLSAPDIAQPIEPLWPLVNEPISFDVLYYSSIWWNLGLLVVAVAVHLVLAYRDDLSVRLVGRSGRT